MIGHGPVWRDASEVPPEVERSKKRVFMVISGLGWDGKRTEPQKGPVNLCIRRKKIQEGGSGQIRSFRWGHGLLRGGEDT